MERRGAFSVSRLRVVAWPVDDEGRGSRSAGPVTAHRGAHRAGWPTGCASPSVGAAAKLPKFAFRSRQLQLRPCRPQ